MITVTVYNQKNGRSLSKTFESREAAAAFVLDLNILYDSSTFTVTVRPEDPR